MIEADKEFNYDQYDGANLLEWFSIWYVKRAKEEKCLPTRTVQDNCLYLPPSSHVNNNVVSGLTLYRQRDLQVQLFVLPPGSKIPMHTHPNMDSFEVYIGGDVFLFIDGKEAGDHARLGEFDYLEDREEFYDLLFLQHFRITPTSPHGGTIGKKGGAFLSIQHWKNKVEPSSPMDDWGEL